MDYAPFKKPSRLAGLFSYRSVIPPPPHEILLAQIFMGAPAARWAVKCKRRIACDEFFVSRKSSSRAHSAAQSRPKSRRSCGGWPRNAPAGAVVSPRNFACANFRGGPGRPLLDKGLAGMLCCFANRMKGKRDAQNHGRRRQYRRKKPSFTAHMQFYRT